MSKDYIFFNEEPNVNILGLNPILRAFVCDEFQDYVGQRLSSFIYEIDNGKFRAGALSREWLSLSTLLFRRMTQDRTFEANTVQHIEQRALTLYQECQRVLPLAYRGDITSTKKKALIRNLFAMFESLCVYGVLGPIVEFGIGGMSKKLSEIIVNKESDVRKQVEYVNLLSYRFEETYDDRGAAALAAIAQKFLESGSYDPRQIDSLRVRVTIRREVGDQIEAYIRQWGWLTYSYAGPLVTVDEVIQQIVDMLNHEQSPHEQIQRRTQQRREQQQRQAKVMEALQLTDEEQYLVSVAQDLTHTKYLRGKIMFLTDYTINTLLRGFARSEEVTVRQLGACTVRDILEYFESDQLPDVDELNQRMVYSLLIDDGDRETMLLGDRAREWVSRHVAAETVDADARELSGQVASPDQGTPVSGTVRVINVREDMEKFHDHDILVSIATTPEIVPVMRKAAAIVTDLGGLTSHAAIVSRELGVPCVIGTKVATKVFKDGDRVEVDATEGIIRKIS